MRKVSARGSLGRWKLRFLTPSHDPPCTLFAFFVSLEASAEERVFATPETTDRLGTSTQMVPEGIATNTNFKRTDNTQSLAGANRAVNVFAVNVQCIS